MTADAFAPLTFITVVFEAEIGLLELQARSMAHCLRVEDVAEIIVLDNCATALFRPSARRLRSWYGPLAPKVRVVRVGALTGGVAQEGWRSQQAAKLLVGREVTSAHYVALDAKIHFLRPSWPDDFVGADGRAHGATHQYLTHPLRSDLERVLAYLGADRPTIDAAMADFPPTHTPYVLDTAMVRAMIDDLETREGMPFGRLFEDHRLLEFFLYAGWVTLRGPGMAAVADGQVVPAPTVWPKEANRAGVARALAEARAQGSPVLAVHRRVLAKADDAALADLAHFWVAEGLFPDDRAVERFVKGFRRRFRAAVGVARAGEKWRELRTRVSP